MSIALFRQEPDAALQVLATASPSTADLVEVLEADGPRPFHEGWRAAFTRGAALLAIGGLDAEDLAACLQAQALESTPEGANNGDTRHCTSSVT